MDFGIEGKVALVLGAAGGLGGAIAASLGREGCKLALADRDELALASVLNNAAGLGVETLGLAWDLGDRSAIGAQVARVEARLGPVDVLINNTGGPPPSRAADTAPEVWTAHFETMVVSVMAVTAALLPGMRGRGWGRIITSASSGVVTPIPTLAVSNGLRAALVGWSKTLAREVARDGVTVNVVAPGRISTNRVAALDRAKADREGRSVEDVARRSADDIPVGRYGRPEEYGDAVAFLASSRASYITGSLVRVDGGLIPSI